MPTYEYECKECAYRFELFQSITAKPARKCPKCGGKLRRLIGAGSAVIFKGAGFYATDYKKGSQEPKDSESKSEKKDEKKTE